jgi:hypothetical protein
MGLRVETELVSRRRRCQERKERQNRQHSRRISQGKKLEKRTKKKPPKRESSLQGWDSNPAVSQATLLLAS